MNMRGFVVLLVLLGLGWILFLRGDGGPVVGEGTGSFRRLELRSALPGTEEETKRLAAYIPEKGLPVFQGSASDTVSFNRTKPAAEDWEPAKNNRIPAIILKGPGAKSVRLPGKFDPKEFTQVIVSAITFGKGAEPVRVVFERGGKDVATSIWLTIPTSKGHPRQLVFEFPHARRAGVAFDAVRVEFRDTNNTDVCAVNGIEIVRRPHVNFLPEPGLGGLVTIELEERRAVGLSTHRPLETSFEVPPAADLFFSYGLDERLRIFGERPVVKMKLEAEGMETLEDSFQLESSRGDKPAWHEKRVDLAEWEGKRARLSFALEVKGDHEAFAVIGEAAVSTRGEDANTVVVITSDTHRADHLSSMTDLVRTPVLDALAGRGVQFTQAFASTNVTNPSHVSLMTATTPRDTHVLNNNTPLAGRARTLAECFADNDYRTFAAVSAYHLLHEESGLGQGFDRINGPKRGERDGAETLDLLEEWLASAAGQPTFVWLHLFDAHAPYKPISRYSDRYWEGGDPYDADTPLDLPNVELPGFLRGLRDKDYPYAMYRGEVDYVDELMGRFLAIPRIENSYLAFTADHGEAFGEHGVWWDHADMYPETLAVPLILAWPEGRTAKSEAPVEQIDIGRTLLDLVGLEDTRFPGRNLMWALDTPEEARPRFGISAHHFVVTVQSGPWMLHLHTREHQEPALEYKREAHQIELYNLVKDPGSLNDLAKDPAQFERAKTMRRAAIDWLNARDEEGLATSKNLSEDALKSLKAMGYSGEDESGAPAFEEDPENPWDAYFAD